MGLCACIHRLPANLLKIEDLRTENNTVDGQTPLRTQSQKGPVMDGGKRTQRIPNPDVTSIKNI